MTGLKAIKPQEIVKKKPKILVFGASGVGKTWTALDFPSVYYIDVEGSATHEHYKKKLIESGGVYLGQDQGALDFDTVIGQVKALATEKHEYKTLIIDSISKLFNTFISDEIERLGDRDQYGASKRLPVAAMRKLIGWLSRLDMNVILIAHERADFATDAKGDRVEIGKTFDCWDKLEYELDMTLRIVHVGNRRNALIGKSRLEEFEQGDDFEWSYSAFADKYGHETMEREAEALNLATDEQLQELKKIFEEKQIPESLESKWFAKAGVSGWDQMPEERVAAAIKYLRENYK